MAFNNSRNNDNTTIRREIGALWLRKNEAGNPYYTGKINLTNIEEIKSKIGDDCKIILFENKNKKNENAPDYHILINKDQYAQIVPEAEQTAPRSQPPKTAAKATFPAAKKKAAPVVEEDDGGIL